MFLPISNIVGIIGATLGMMASTYIYHQKQQKKTLACPRSAPCDTVVHSSFSSTVGIPNDLLGIAYYVILGELYAASLGFPVLQVSTMYWSIMVLTSCGVLFSLYLIALQAFRLRTWCLWCVISAISNAVLLAAIFFLPRPDLYEMLASQAGFWSIIRMMGISLGVASATIADVLLFRLLSHGDATEDEKETLDTLWGLMWTGLAMNIIAMVMIYVPLQHALWTSARFLLEAIVSVIIAINGVALGMLVGPKLQLRSFAADPKHEMFRRIACALAGVSIVSWYAMLALSAYHGISMPLRLGVASYVAVLGGTALGSQVFESVMTKHRKNAGEKKARSKKA